MWAGTAMCLTVRVSNPGDSEIFRTRPYRSWGPLCLLHNGHCVIFPGVKRPWLGVDHPPPSKAEVKERVKLFPFGAFATCSMVTLTFTCTSIFYAIFKAH